MNVSPGKDEDGNDLPPLSQKEKSRRSRQLFVDRVQAFHEACYTELSAQSALTLTKTQRGKKVPASGKMVARSFKEEKPTLAQWWKLKLHVEEHYHRASWVRANATLPVHGHESLRVFYVSTSRTLVALTATDTPPTVLRHSRKASLS